MQSFLQFIESLNRRDFIKSAVGAALGGNVYGQQVGIVDKLMSSPDPVSEMKKIGNYEKIWDALENAQTNKNYDQKKLENLIREVKFLIEKRNIANKALERTKSQEEAKRFAKFELVKFAKHVGNDGVGAKTLAEKLWYYEFAAKLTPQEVVTILKDGGIKNVNSVLRSAAVENKNVEKWLNSVIDWNYK